MGPTLRRRKRSSDEPEERDDSLRMHESHRKLRSTMLNRDDAESSANSLSKMFPEPVSLPSVRRRFVAPDLGGINGMNEMENELQDTIDQEDMESLIDGIRISNTDKINYPGLIKDMHERFKRKAEKWERLANWYSRCSLFFNFGILMMQMMQMLVTQLCDIYEYSSRNSKALQCIIAAMSGLFIGLQMKLKLIQKAEKYRRGAKVYGRLRRTSVYYLMLLENGGRVDDITGLWREAMNQESKQIPVAKTFIVS